MDASEFDTKGTCADCGLEDMLRPFTRNGRRSTMRCLTCTELLNLKTEQARQKRDAHNAQIMKDVRRARDGRDWPWTRR